LGTYWRHRAAFSLGPHVQYVLVTRTGLGRWVRTAYCGNPGTERLLFLDSTMCVAEASSGDLTVLVRPKLRVDPDDGE